MKLVRVSNVIVMHYVNMRATWLAQRFTVSVGQATHGVFEFDENQLGFENASDLGTV